MHQSSSYGCSNRLAQSWYVKFWKTSCTDTDILRLQDTTAAYTAEDVYRDYFCHLVRVYKGVQSFIQNWGAKSLYDIARDPTCSNNEKISDIIDIRLAQKLPTMEPMGWTDNRFIQFGFSQTVDMSTEAENLICSATNFPPLWHCTTYILH